MLDNLPQLWNTVFYCDEVILSLVGNFVLKYMFCVAMSQNVVFMFWCYPFGLGIGGGVCDYKKDFNTLRN